MRPLRAYLGLNSKEKMMPKGARNTGKQWTSAQKQTLRGLARGNTPTRLIAWKMGRSPGAIYTQGARQGTSLKPTNQRPRG
jgi:hypothetical protein